VCRSKKPPARRRRHEKPAFFADSMACVSPVRIAARNKG
jgi:hypothetical protein